MTTRADDNSDDTTAVRAPDYVDTNYLFPQVKAYDPELLISGSGVRNPDGALQGLFLGSRRCGGVLYAPLLSSVTGVSGFIS